ncbi:MAG TPA: SDR family oxidoreductase, partial [Candidatus Polarisedimenticolia bacterium]|nr:SDR family oxidoreductase [Candidatus Polarisedimenticolia bacterium]
SIVSSLRDAGATVMGADLAGRRAPRAHSSWEGDLSDPAAAPRLVETVERELGRLDIVVHAAGIRRDAVLWKMQATAWSEVMRVNLGSAFHLLKAAAPVMRRGGRGAVVLISSINGERGKFGQINYSASKAGLIGLGRTAARELGRFGIRVNIICPGMIRTPLVRDLPEDAMSQALSESVLGRLGEPEDVAAAAIFLCSPMSRHITGQVLRVDGGQLIG